MREGHKKQIAYDESVIVGSNVLIGIFRRLRARSSKVRFKEGHLTMVG